MYFLAVRCAPLKAKVTAVYVRALGKCVMNFKIQLLNVYIDIYTHIYMYVHVYQLDPAFSRQTEPPCLHYFPQNPSQVTCTDSDMSGCIDICN